VKVTTDEGVTGWGERVSGSPSAAPRAMPSPTPFAPLRGSAAIRANIAALVNDIARKQHNCSRNGPVAFRAVRARPLRSGISRARLAGQPLYRLLGGAGSRRAGWPAYASLLRYGSTELVERKSAEAVQKGYTRRQAA